MRIPCLIINRNYHRFLVDLVERLSQLNLSLHIIDCASAWPPLLDWYRTLPPEISLWRTTNEHMHRTPWEGGFAAAITRAAGAPYYIVTDPDLDLSETPDDVVDVLAGHLCRHPEAVKVGLSLRLDDIPAEAPLNADAHRTEYMYWRRLRDGLYVAGIDTTFAMYRTADPRAQRHVIRPALRTPPPYCCRHLPWYLTGETVTAEDRFRVPVAETGRNGAKLLEMIA